MQKHLRLILVMTTFTLDNSDMDDFLRYYFLHFIKTSSEKVRLL